MKIIHLGIHRGFGEKENCGGEVHFIYVAMNGFRQCTRCGELGPLCRIQSEWMNDLVDQQDLIYMERAA